MVLREAGTWEVAPATMPSGTSVLEKALLLLIIVTLPLESHLLILPGFSVQFIMFAVVGVYLLLTHPRVMLRTSIEPVFVAAYVFVVIGFAMEFTSNHASFVELFRILQMIVGAILLASICRDLPTLRLALFGYLAAGVWLSALLFLTSYGAIQASTAATFDEASTLRAETFADNPLQANLNGMAFIAGQGAVVALGFVLRARTNLQLVLFALAGFVCLLAAFLPLSRGGIAITLASCAAVLYAFGLRSGKVFLVAALLAGAIVTWVPQSVWSRMSFSFESRDGKVEGRALVYDAAIQHLPDYVVTGVGAGNFWTAWGRRSAFGDYKGRVSGAHNSYLQVTLYWGLGGLLAFLLVLWRAYRCLPPSGSREAASLCLVGLGMSLLLFSFVNHNLYGKEYCLGLGLLAGANAWVWRGVWADQGGDRRADLRAPDAHARTATGESPDVHGSRGRRRPSLGYGFVTGR